MRHGARSSAAPFLGQAGGEWVVGEGEARKGGSCTGREGAWAGLGRLARAPPLLLASRKWMLLVASISFCRSAASCRFWIDAIACSSVKIPFAQVGGVVWGPLVAG